MHQTQFAYLFMKKKREKGKRLRPPIKPTIREVESSMLLLPMGKGVGL